jgi:hypothetical protein
MLSRETNINQNHSIKLSIFDLKKARHKQNSTYEMRKEERESVRIYRKRREKESTHQQKRDTRLEASVLFPIFYLFYVLSCTHTHTHVFITKRK